MSDGPGTEDFGSFVCARCNARSQHVRVPLQVMAERGSFKSSIPFADDVRFGFTHDGLSATDVVSRTSWEVTVCMGCRRPTVWRESVAIYPLATPIPPHEDMPQDALDLFAEAAQVAPISRRAAAALARASLEVLLKELFPESGARDLQARVGELQQHVRPNLWKLLTTLRVVGNDALHSTPDTVSIDLTGQDGEIIETLLGAINMLVEELITQPKQADALYDQLPAAKREAAERAAAKFTNPV